MRKGAGTSLPILIAAQLMKADYSPHFLYSFEWWDVKVFIVSLISYFSLPFAYYSLMIWLIWIMLSERCVVKYFLFIPNLCDCQTNNKVFVIPK